MELKSTISDTWKLCIFGSLVGCFLLLLFINQSYHSSFSIARNTMIGLSPLGQLHHASHSTIIMTKNPLSKPELEPEPDPEPEPEPVFEFEPSSSNNAPLTMAKVIKTKPSSSTTKVIAKDSKPEPEPSSLSMAKGLEHEPPNSTTKFIAKEPEPKPKPKYEPEPEPESSSLNIGPLSMAYLETEPELEPSNSTTKFIAKDPKPEFELKPEPEPEPEPEPKPSNSTMGDMMSELQSKQVNFSVDHPIEKSNLTTFHPIENPMNKTGKKKCNIFDGRWVYKEDRVPTYNSSVCPFLEEKMSCRKNGRPDSNYENWIWEGKDCEIPLFNGIDMLERLRNKRVVVVGDSLNRNQWESLACLIYSSIHPSRAMVDAGGSSYKVLVAKDYNFKLEFYWSPFLIEMDEKHESGKKVLKLDKLSPSSQQWRGADVMVFNSGHWWIHLGKYKAWDSYEYKGELIDEMPIEVAYEHGMRTWAKWVETNVDPKKTSVFFRSISAEHKGKHWCYNSTQPIPDESYKSFFPKSVIKIIEKQIQDMNHKTQMVNYLNITKLSGYRMDAHPSVYRSWRWKIYTQKYKRLIPSYADCSHWCLPGLPDTWNRLLYVSLFFDSL